MFIYLSITSHHITLYPWSFFGPTSLAGVGGSRFALDRNPFLFLPSVPLSLRVVVASMHALMWRYRTYLLLSFLLLLLGCWNARANLVNSRQADRQTKQVDKIPTQSINTEVLFFALFFRGLLVWYWWCLLLLQVQAYYIGAVTIRMLALNMYTH